MTADLTQEQRNILEHTAYRAANGFYCGDSTDMQVLIVQGLMKYAGKKAFCDAYFKLTDLGKHVLAVSEQNQE